MPNNVHTRTGWSLSKLCHTKRSMKASVIVCVNFHDHFVKPMLRIFNLTLYLKVWPHVHVPIKKVMLFHFFTPSYLAIHVQRQRIDLIYRPTLGTLLSGLFSLVDIGPKMAWVGSGLYQKFYGILLLPTSGSISQLVYSTGVPPYAYIYGSLTRK